MISVGNFRSDAAMPREIRMPRACGRRTIKALMTGNFGKREISMVMLPPNCYNVFEMMWKRLMEGKGVERNGNATEKTSDWN